VTDWLEFAIIAVIIGGIALAVFRAGAANPEPTGAIGKEVGTLKNRISHIEKAVAEIRASAATSDDIEVIRAEMKGDRELSARTYASVQRIENFLIEKGLGGR